jgi:glycosyltransferase involved in cell wall biosynthesis
VNDLPGARSLVTRRVRLLYLAFYFPPLGGGGVQRTVKFVKYLPEFGIEPIVVTGPADRRTRHAPLDASLASDIPPDSRIYRVPGQLPDDSRPERLRRLVGYPSRFARAWASCCETTARHAARHGGPIDVILATMSPFETSDAAAKVAAAMRIPWVADLRDPWALDETIVYPTRWHRARELRRMRRSLSSASLVIMNTPEAARAVRSAFPELSKRTIAITNGFDAADYLGVPPARRDNRFRIVHTGRLHVALGSAHNRRLWLRRWIGGERVPVNILARSHVYLLSALERWYRDRPDEVGRTELLLAGDLSPEDHRVVEGSPVADRVTMLGYVLHSEAIQQLRNGDLLFLPMHALPRGERARIVPGKTYEYLAAGKPILAAVPEGDARDFVMKSGLGEVCEPDDVEAMVEILRRRFAAKQAGEPVQATTSFHLQFERRKLTARLARALVSVITAPPGEDRGPSRTA